MQSNTWFNSLLMPNYGLTNIVNIVIGNTISSFLNVIYLHLIIH